MENLVDKTLKISKIKTYILKQSFIKIDHRNHKIKFQFTFATAALFFKHGNHHEKSELYWQTVLKKFRGGNIKMY